MLVEAGLVRHGASGVCLARKNIMADAFWGKKGGGEKGVLHWVKKIDYLGFYRSKCGYSIDRHDSYNRVSSEMLVHFLCCKKCIASIEKERK